MVIDTGASSTVSHTPLFVAFAGGGTGGHLYPGLAVAEALRALVPDVRVVFFGTHRPIDHEILGATDYELIRQTLPVISRKPWRWPKTFFQFRSATQLCRSRLTMDRPSVVVGTGGFGSVAAIREARRLGIPTAIINPDVIPGRANRYLAPLAEIVFAQWSEAADRLPARVNMVTTGCPIRSAFGRATREQGVERFGLDGSRKTLLVTGASQGARTVNHAVTENLDFFAEPTEWQLLHLTGEADYEAVVEAYARCDVGAKVLPFTQHMPEAMAAADLVVTRGGASSLAEATAVGVPSVVLPYPFHRDRHQEANAECLVRAGAAVMVVDQIDPAINGPALREALAPLMANEQERLAMAKAARSLGKPNAAATVAEHLAIMTCGGPALRKCETMEAAL